ncbi:MAG TPA: 1,2-phenylacetyl-CoA epoxidase subunit PaaD [Actinomycetota bacterium]|nr:1,2-phenylacetyl-CoA epoxidase subunit PaaD [Actinomycetota bacterium]
MVTETTSVLDDVRAAVARVRDPEIPAGTIADLGMIHDVRVAGDAVEIELLPTFVGCPAKDVIGEDVRRAAEPVADRPVGVRFVYDPPWTTDRITEQGRARLREFGIAPHWERGPEPVPIPLLSRAGVQCPFCGSEETVMDSAWGVTPCRSTHYCRSCRNPFEGFKTKSL